MNFMCLPNTEDPANQLHDTDKRGKINFITRHHHSAHHIRVASKILRRAMH